MDSEWALLMSPDSNQHPNVAGHIKIANLFEKWLEAWGLSPQDMWF